jgi:AraC-like DNA-binding protein
VTGDGGGYRELAPPPGLAGLFACAWGFHRDAVLVLPDGCVDVVHHAGRLRVAGPATAPVAVPAAEDGLRFGVRFRVGVAGAALGVEAHELADRSVELADLWGTAGRRLEHRVAAGANDAERLRALVAGVADRWRHPADGDPVVRQAVWELARGTSVAATAREVGIGERQLRRRFERAVGYGPATFVRVERFQRFLRLAQAAPGASVGRLAARAGYADQAHLDRECRRLSGRTPTELLAGRPIVAGDKSDRFKQPDAGRITLGA